MKKIYLLLFLLTATHLSFGQLSENFDNLDVSSYYTGSTTLESGQWTMSQVFKEDSSSRSGIAPRINDDKNNAHITTPALNGAGTVSFWYRELSSGGGTFELQTSTDGSNFTTVTSQNYSGTTFTEFSFDVNDTSSNLFIRILSDDNAGHLIIDDFEVTAPIISTDTQVQFAAEEASVSEGVGTYNLEFTILNEDTAATSFDVALTSGDASEINNYSTQTVTFPANSSTNQTATITVTDDMDFEPDDTLTFTIQNVTGGNNAQAGAQDTFNLTITNNDAMPSLALPFTEDFESGVPPTNWTAFRGINNLGDQQDWKINADANTGSNAAYVSDEDAGNDTEDWLVTPPIDLSSISNAELTFFSKTIYSTDYGSEYTIRVSTTSQTEHAAFTTIETYTETQIGNDYNQKTVNLSSYAGQSTIYIAFVLTQDYGDGWKLDDVSVTEVIPKDQDTEVYTSDFPVAATTLTAEDNTTAATSKDVFAFNIEDQGTSDGLPTNITTMRFVPATNNTADWTDHLQGITLYDDSLNDYTPTTTTIEDDEIVLTFSTPIVIADATAVEFFLGVYLNTTNITDGSILEFNIPETASGFTADTAGSGFASSLPSGEVNSSQFTIDVEVAQLVFTQQPTDTEIEAIMTPQVTVAAVDANGNIDTDYDLDITITSSGILTGTSIVASATNGVATFATLIHTVVANGLTLTANDDDYAGPVTSNTFNCNEIVIVPSLIISEVADPDNNANNGRFVELYNNGTTTIDLDAQNIYLVNQVNGGSRYNITLTGTINPGEVYVISGSTSFNNTYGFDSNKNNNQVSGNGDDGYYLYFDGNYSSGTLLDAYGVIGEDGTGKDWVYEDARAIRNNPKTTNPNATWTASEWTITDADDVDMTPGALENEFRYNNAAWMPRNGFDNATSGDEVIIFSNINADDNLTAKSLEIKTGATYTVTPGNAITITENIINNGNLTLQSTSNSFSSLIVDGTVTGAVNYQRFVNATTNGNDVIAPPVTGQTWADFLTNNQSALLNNGTTYGFAPFDKTATPANYVNYTNTTVATLANGSGYRTATASGETLTFTGNVATAPVTAPITTSGTGYEQWNLIGNPFPSYITLNEFLTANNAKFATEEAGIYGYNGSDFTVYNLAYAQANPGTQIAPGQGFFVAAATVAETVTFTNAMRTTGTDDDFINGRANNTSISYLQLQLSTPSNATATEFYFTANASQGLDHGYDAAMFGNTTPEFSLYSHLVQDNQGRAMLVQSLSDNDLTNVTVALGVNANQGEQITFSINESTLPQTVQVYLEDNATNTFTLLNSGDYTITPSESINGTGRFFLRYADSALNTSQNELNSLNIFAQAETKTIEIRGLLAHKTTCTLYDIQGRAIKTVSLNTNTNTQAIATNNLSTGVYIVKLTNSTQQKTQKVIIK